MQYKIVFTTNKYDNYELRDAYTLEHTSLNNFNPKDHKIFNFDIFEFNKELNKINVVHSIIKKMPKISGILVINNGKTYGKTENNKFYYKCIPDDKRIIPFLIPYKIKNINFTKNYVNKYVVFNFVSWENKHPIGELSCVIGDVNKLENFYEYQLYCKSLYASIQEFTKATKQKLKEHSQETFIEQINKTYNVEDRRNIHNIFTIDPINSKDFDDAFSFDILENNTFKISIYISNVAIWMNIMGLWSSFSQRIATIYLPDRKRPMLPTILSDVLCSLQEQQTRFAFTFDIISDAEGNIISHKFLNTCIIVEKNYRYNDDTSSIINFEKFKYILQKMNKFSRCVNEINDTHNVVTYLMILMNFITAKEFLKFKTGIFRSMKINNNIVSPDYLPKDIRDFYKLWKSNGSKYISFEEDKIHDMLKVNEYTHITSPIRRLVDLINMIELQDCLNIMKFNDESKKFHGYWTSKVKLDYINTTMQSIRKVQNECNLLTRCVKEQHILNRTYNGFIFDVMYRNDGLYQYVVFLRELKMINKFISFNKLELYSSHPFKIYLFEDKESLKQKVRYEIQDFTNKETV